MKIGLIGLQNSGKTTIFNALTGLEAEVTSYSTGKVEPNMGIVEVKDERIEKLAEIYEPEKKVYAHIEYIDFGGLTGENENIDVFSDSSMALVKTADALALVVRNFNDEIISQTLGKPDPIKDIQQIESELIISDLIIAEKRAEKIILNKKRGLKDAKLLLEEKVINKVIQFLNEDKPLRDLELADDEEKSIKGFQFISRKPLLIILNSDEDNFGANQKILNEVEKNYKAIEFAGNFEMELSKLPEDEAKEFMEDLNIKESARDRLTKSSYDLMGYISFFTKGKDEVRAWTITEGDKAVEAAGKIHSDLARGFIRAECFSYDDLMTAGSEKVIKEKGLFRLEGKNYLVKDGDILTIRFNV
ncbi:MAG TPA: redox-regulated ATPase YchF [Candidatus Cloacimonetes bacterium]|nr:redox-regulated ATPase YchF [Candidatus Cloacimonadota bacterium]